MKKNRKPNGKNIEISLELLELSLIIKNSVKKAVKKKLKQKKKIGVPNGIRTRVTALKGRCPRPG
jgi:hypothetical protein